MSQFIWEKQANKILDNEFANKLMTNAFNHGRILILNIEH